MADGRRVTRELVMTTADEEMAKIRQALGEAAFGQGRFAEARALFEEVALSDDFVEFLTLPAYRQID
jgi:malate synthase